MTTEEFKKVFEMMSDIHKELCYVASKLHLGGYTELSASVSKAKEVVKEAAKEVSFEAMFRIVGGVE